MLSQKKLEAMKRIKNEYRNSPPNSNIGFVVGLIDQENYFKWVVTMLGPKDSPYRGALFYLEVDFPDNYPESAPEIYFITPIYHLNVNPYNNSNWGIKLGHVSLNVLNDWKPEYTIKEIFIYIYALLYNPNPNFAFGFERVNEFKFNRKLYEEKAKYFTHKYANPINWNFRKRYDKWDFSY